MTCREFVEFLMEYGSGGLPAAQRDAFEAHINHCPACVAYLKSYEHTVRLGKAAFVNPDDRLPDDVPEELVKAILTARKRAG